MEGKKEQPAPAPLPPHYYYPPMAYPDDEISLADLWRVLVRQWKWIAACTFLSVAAAAVYLVTATPVYEAEAVLLPPEAQHVQALNIPEISEISGTEIYDKYIGNLKSNSLRRQFFNENNLEAVLRGESQAATETIFQNRFNKRLHIKEESKSEAGTVFVTLQAEDPELAAQWVNELILLAGRKTIQEGIVGIHRKIANQQHSLQDQIEIARDSAKRRRSDRLAMLDEQIAIARDLKIMNRDDIPLRAVEGKNLGVALTTSAEPLYMRGVKELTAERETLLKRKNNDPFISGLRENQEKLAQLEAGLKQLQTAVLQAYAAKVDRKAIPPEYPIKPKKKLVLVLSLILGGMLGIFAAFFVNFIAQQKTDK